MTQELDCRDASRWLSRLQDEALPADERARLRLHLLLCADCRHVDEQLRFIRAAMQRLAAGDEPSPEPGREGP